MSLVNGTKRLKSWFFTVTAVGFKKGDRFLTDNRPSEQSLRDLLESIPNSSEITSQAQRDDSSSNLGDKAGLTILATAAQAKANTTPSGGKALVPTTEQLPTVAGDLQNIVINGSSFDDDVLVSIVDSTVTTRNNFLITLKSTFVTYLKALIESLQTQINSTLVTLGNLSDDYTEFKSTTNSSISTINTTLSGLVAAILPVGSVLSIMNTAASITQGTAIWLNMDGRAVSRTTYAPLFGLLGTTYGVGDGTTTFNLPNVNNKVLRGNSTTIGTSGGADTLTIGAANLPAHVHSMTSGNGATVSITGGTHSHPEGIDSAASGGATSVVTSGTGIGSTGNASHTHATSEFSGNTGNNISANTAISVVQAYLGSPMFIKAT